MEERKYGFFNNFLYVLKMLFKSNKRLFAFSLIEPVAECANTFIGMYFLKIIIAIFEKGEGTDTLIATVVSISVIMFVLTVICNFYYNFLEYSYIKTDTYLEKMRMKKVYDTDFKNMESPKFLDFLQRAKAALYNGMGFQGVTRQIKNILCQGALTIIAAVMIGSKNIIVVIAITVMSVAMSKILSYVTEKDKVKFSDFMAPTYRKMGYLDNTARNFDFAKDIRLYNLAGIFGSKYKELNELFVKKNKEHHNRWILGNLSMQLLVLAEVLVMYGWLIYMVLFKEMLVSDFILYLALSKRYTDAIGNLLWIYSNVKGNTLMVNDFRNFVEWPEDKDQYLESEGKRTDVKNRGYKFKFEHVSFKYPGCENYVLKDVNITIDAGMRLAIVGVNGAGKTTFVKLIMKLYEPTEGRILLNGVDIKEYDREEYFKIFSPVFQNIECFALPIYQNISFKEESETDMEKVKVALEKSGLWKKVSSYSSGVKTNMLKIFDESGIDLSGGERQRLAMARALYKEGDVIILDEPTAALDALAEDNMYREFDSMVGNKTSIFISHRLGSTRFCDKIAMFEDGRIVEEGTHDSLMELNGKYAYMFGIQAQYYEEGEDND
ncbi:MAG: ABC transporter ATP-binding protein [Lachnospiraceae bacterium]|nr:ABC transporter ATP-binding protein [Lachnospiraceae bacterium]